MTISELISSIRVMNRQVNADSRMTDRFIYYEAISVRNQLLKQEQLKNRLFGLTSLFKTLKYVELIDIDPVEACGIDTDCKIKRTLNKLPKILETTGGYVIKNVASLDGSQNLTYISDVSFVRKLSIGDKYALKELFYFVRDDYMYFPNLEWDAVKIQAIFEDPDLIDTLNNQCRSCEQPATDCTPAYEKEFSLPNYLDKSLKDMLNDSLSRYYHRLREDTNINKNPND